MNTHDTQGHPSSPLSYNLLVALPGDSEIIDLIEEFHQLGWSAVHAETPEMVVQAAQVAAVVVALAPLIEDTAIFATIKRIDPRCLIPVLTKTMPIPYGPWSSPPIQMSTPLRQVASQILDAIRQCSSEE